MEETLCINDFKDSTMDTHICHLQLMNKVNIPTLMFHYVLGWWELSIVVSRLQAGESPPIPVKMN